MNIAKREYMTGFVVIVVFVGLLLPSLRTSRREVRDGARRTAVLVMKGEIERYFNMHDQYPMEYETVNISYVVTERDGRAARAWYLRTELENEAQSANGFDLEHNVFWRVTKLGDRTFYDVCGGESECDL